MRKAWVEPKSTGLGLLFALSFYVNAIPFNPALSGKVSFRSFQRSALAGKAISPASPILACEMAFPPRALFRVFDRNRFIGDHNDQGLGRRWAILSRVSQTKRHSHPKSCSERLAEAAILTMARYEGSGVGCAISSRVSGGPHRGSEGIAHPAPEPARPNNPPRPA